MLQRARKVIFKYLIIFGAIQAVSCGTILYPERCGQPAGRIDPGVVALDAVGLLVFFIPGVIAFVVDFSNGTIYLPPERTAFAYPDNSGRLQTVRVNPTELTSQRLEAVLQEHTGQAVHLKTGSYRVARINAVQDFTATAVDTLRAGPAATSVVFRGTAD